MTDRSGVEIDYCPKCRGVWLDRGELDKIIERSEGGSAPVHGESHKTITRIADNSGHPDAFRQQYPAKKRKESFLGDLFDF
jgi:Zn-finger nucleic acid-binding protein